MSTAAPAASTWGGLHIAGMSLALPLAALREVVPLPLLAPLPCACPAVAGGLDLRGVTVPVIDLAVLLGRPAALPSSRCVVTVVHGGRLIGLLAESVNGIFRAEAAAAPPEATDTPATAFAGSLRRADTQALVNVLALPLLAAMPELPWIDDPEPLRQALVDTDPGTDAVMAPDAARQALMLVRCGALALAIDALAVHATLWGPRIDRSVLARGACRGTIDFDGRRIAAVDLLALCRLGELPAGGARQAVVTRDPQGGLVALLVEHVMDIVNVPAGAVVPMAAALPQPGLLRGLIDGRSLQGEARRFDFFVLDAQALAALDEMHDLARTNTPVAGADSPAASSPDAASRDEAGSRSVITFHLPVEKAVPMEQVIEILPYGERDAMFGPGHPLRRIQVLRGRSLPVYCLARLSGGSVDRITPAAAVLVVESGGELVGFGVPHLRSIERAHWRRSVPVAGAGRPEMATVGEGAGRRTLELLDLCALAARVRSGDALRSA